MLAKFKTILSGLPVIRFFVRKAKIKKIHEEKNLVGKTRDKILYSSFTTHDISLLNDFLMTGSIIPNDIDRVPLTTPVSFYTQTVQQGLEGVRRKLYSKAEIQHCSTIHLVRETRPLAFWLSSNEAVNWFHVFMTDMIAKYVALETRDPSAKNLREEEMIFLRSILFRLLLVDYLTFLMLILDARYAICSQKETDPKRRPHRYPL